MAKRASRAERAWPQREAVEPELQRRILDFFNRVRTDREIEEATGLGRDLAKKILEFRSLLRGARFLDLEEIRELLGPNIERILARFGPGRYGRWTILPYNVQRPDGTLFATAHAALLRTGQVLFLPGIQPSGDTTETLLWDPSDEVAPQFEFPTNQPADYLFCSGHSFLSDGRLLVVGGGGNYASNATDTGWIFDPAAKSWTATAHRMAHRRWYPTCVTLPNRRVLVASGINPADVAQIEIYRETADDFVPVVGPSSNPAAADRVFPETYPGLHLLPSGDIFFSRTGWGHAGRNEGGARVSFLRFSGSARGEWVEIPEDMDNPDRTEGMSVQLLTPCEAHGWDAKVMIVGGGNPSTAGRDTAEVIEVSSLSPRWEHLRTLPEERFHVNAVLLPDGTVFIVGGIGSMDSPCRLYDPPTDTFEEVAEVHYRREYHSVALLLPSGKVAVTGGDDGNTLAQKTTIEVFSPPYLFHGGARPKIDAAPTSIRYGHSFEVESPQAASTARVALVRPMAITHHTDSEQRVVPLPFTRHGNRLRVAAPEGHHAETVAPRGQYMLFLVDDRGVPSEGAFVRLE